MRKLLSLGRQCSPGPPLGERLSSSLHTSRPSGSADPFRQGRTCILSTAWEQLSGSEVRSPEGVSPNPPASSRFREHFLKVHLRCLGHFCSLLQMSIWGVESAHIVCVVSRRTHMFTKHGMFLFTFADHILLKGKNIVGLRVQDLVWCYGKVEETAKSGT